MTEDNKAGRDARELAIIVGLRALLGDPKAQKQMVKLQGDHPAYAKEIMAEAQVRHDALSPEEKEKPETVTAKLTLRTVKLRFKLIVTLYPRSIWWWLKQRTGIGRGG